MKKVSTEQALEQIGSVYVRFLKHPKKRVNILRHMISLTNIIVNDPKVLESVKQRAQDNLEKYRDML